MKKILLMMTLLLMSISSYPQFLIRKQVVQPKVADSLDLSYYSKKKPLHAAGLVVGINMGVWAFDRYIRKADFAYINMKTMHANLKKGFVWDNDAIGTNMFMHPYHGNLYFNSARSNGYNYWESGAFAAGGSLMWELFMENESPSTNDFIATPIGGMCLGEVLYRTSDMILDDRRVGWSRFGHEFAAFLIAPTKGLTRIITGDAWKRRSTSGKQFGVPDVSVEVSTGVRFLELRDEIFDKGAGATTQINVEYGDRYDSDNKLPYDYFNFRINLNIQASQPALGQVNIMGRLWGTELVDNSKDYFNLGVYQYFDYYNSDTISTVSNRIPFKFGVPASVGLGFIHKSKRFTNWDFNTYGHLNAILLGASLSDHYLVDQRNYNLGSGFGWKLGANIAYKDKFGLSWWYEAYRVFTWKGYPDSYDLSTALENDLSAQGDKSNVFFHLTSLRADLKLNNYIYLTALGSLYHRDTRYSFKQYEDVTSTTGEGRLMLTYKFW